MMRRRFMRLQEALKNKKMNNKGAALVLAIAAVAFVGILAALILWMSYINYFMKVTDMRSTNNFYSAEGVVEQIKTGLETEVSNSMSDSYSEVLSRYSGYSQAERESMFMNSVVTSVKNVLMVKGDTSKYNLAHLCNYVNQTGSKLDETSPAENYTLSVPGDKSQTNTVEIKGDPACVMAVSGNQLVLKNVYVKYTDTNGYVSIIKTDFRLQAPKMDFSIAGEQAEIFKYALIADGQLQDNTAAKVEVNACTYAGGIGTDDKGKNYKDAFIVGDGADLRFTGEDSNVVCGKNISLGVSSSLDVSEKTNLFTDNITLEGNSANLNLNGTSYVADDLTLKGSGGNVKLSGWYYGYGVGNEEVSRENREGLSADEENLSSPSSAIIINGRDSQVDLTGLDTLVLGGRSYIGTSALKNSDNKSQKNIGMSESIAIRGNQIAYLVPSAALGKKEGKSTVTSNPMTLSEYENKIAKYMPNDIPLEDFVECDLENTCVPGTNVPIAPNYAVAGKDGYRKIFDQVHGLVYYYMVMDAAGANAYFEKYYSVAANKARIDKYAQYYVSGGGIQVGNEADFARFDVAGNYMSTEDGETAVNPAGEAALNAESMIYENMFTALNHKLTQNIGTVTADELSKSVYENFVQENYVVHYAGSPLTFTLEREADDDLIGIVVDGNYTYSGSSSGKQVRLIIASGDVTVTKDFEGTIIAKGNIKIASGVNIKNDAFTQKDIAVVLNASKELGGKDVHLYDFIINGEIYADKSSEEEIEDNTAKELVAYENWQKK